MQVRLVRDPERAEMDEPTDARVGRGPYDVRVPSVLTSRRLAPPSQSRGIAARWTIASTPSSAAGSDARSVTSPRRVVRLARWAGSRRRLTRSPDASEPTSATTSCPASMSAGTTWLPTNPLAPVTRTVDMLDPLSA